MGFGETVVRACPFDADCCAREHAAREHPRRCGRAAGGGSAARNATGVCGRVRRRRPGLPDRFRVPPGRADARRAEARLGAGRHDGSASNRGRLSTSEDGSTTTTTAGCSSLAVHPDFSDHAVGLLALHVRPAGRVPRRHRSGSPVDRAGAVAQLMRVRRRCRHKLHDGEGGIEEIMLGRNSTRDKIGEETTA